MKSNKSTKRINIRFKKFGSELSPKFLGLLSHQLNDKHKLRPLNELEATTFIFKVLWPLMESRLPDSLDKSVGIYHECILFLFKI